MPNKEYKTLAKDCTGRMECCKRRISQWGLPDIVVDAMLEGVRNRGLSYVVKQDGTGHRAIFIDSEWVSYY
jgi:hypothetical protein